MRTQGTFAKRDAAVVLCCAVFVLANLGAVGSTGRRRAREAVCLSNLMQWGRIWKSYADDHDGYFPRRSGMLYWPWKILDYKPDINRKLCFCPEATKAWAEGGVCPFASWSYVEDGVRIDSSYTVNFWATDDDSTKFWRTPYVADAAKVPLLLDGSWMDAEPLADDDPPPSMEWIQTNCWEPNRNEMKRVCHYRHESIVNGVFLDLSARRIGLKELWQLKWHREWPQYNPPPAWPEWMENFKDY